MDTRALFVYVVLGLCISLRHIPSFWCAPTRETRPLTVTKPHIFILQALSFDETNDEIRYIESCPAIPGVRRFSSILPNPF
ncbi:hypothetical protein F4804DRAFT_260271 [Jackrogersella minutella]|nr:hypothetical protein F4804DRAFT_260271 [Jackrogersella minutella]